ncbi:2-oxoglutarate and iron-dependent oxygenase JMJD4-like [Amphiura filiformis]|uniref:2-oxoglutarate and iron-dependent oxygenase JMJD4-like n=1 Tax=Amphiura filiformis TaxID=82378 RepID=UPI003B2154A3
MDSLTQETLHKIQSVVIDQIRKEPVKSVDHITERISYQDFFVKYLLPNRPCLLSSYVTAKWRSVKEWVKEDGQPNLDFLASNFGDALVPVADCNKVQYYAQPKTDMKLVNYIEYWKDHISKGHKSKEGCLYLKDWHFVHVFTEYQAYETPIYFTSDWLNEFWDLRSDRTDDDYRFVYMGPKGSWTPFHADVFRSFSWSANICGRKKWLLFPPGEERHLKDHLGNLPYDVTSCELHDGKKYPNYKNACQPFEVVQEAGEVIFVPSGWHHQVYNLEDTISINHNWLNGCNIDIMWEFLQQELCTIQKSISDCIDMEGWHNQCQLIMKASTGIDYAEFFLFLHIIASHRLQLLRRCSRQMSEQVVSKSSDLDQLKHDNTHDDDSVSKLNYEHTKSLEVCKTQKLSGELPTTENSKSLCEDDTSTHLLSGTFESMAINEISACQRLPDSSQESVWHAVFDIDQVKKILECLMKNEEFQELENNVLCDDPKQIYRNICDALNEYSL